MNAKVDAYLERARSWRPEMEKLRSIALDCGLDETLKWGKPCYTWGKGNVGIIQPFKNQVAFLFFKGALLEDPDGHLHRPGENSHVGRRMEFTGLTDLEDREPALRGFIAQAIGNEQQGRKVEVPDRPQALPDELEAAFGEVDGLMAAFEGLTPGRQRAYLLHFTGAKQAKTRRARIDKWTPAILQGKGMRD